MIQPEVVFFVMILALSFSLPQNTQEFEDGKINGRIIDGYTALPGEFPYQVSIRLSGAHKCGGSIISPDWILTSARCLHGHHPEDLNVIVGAIFLNGSDGYTHEVSEIIIHEGFRKPYKYSNDIGLLRVAKSINQNNLVARVELTSEPSKFDTPCIVAGWGTTTNEGNTPPSLLQFTDVDIVDLHRCTRKLFPNPVEDSNICAKNTHSVKRICIGDFGGALVCDGKQHGIASFVKRNCLEDFPGVYVGVYWYRQWISAKIGL